MAEAYRQDGQLNIPTQAAADEMFKQKFGMSPQEWAAREGTIDNVPEISAADVARYAGQSFGFGTGDEIEALFRTGQISGEEFEAARSAATKSAQHFENQRPNAALAMDLAGFAPVVAGMAMSAPVSVPAAFGTAAIKGGQKFQKFLQKVGPVKIGVLGGFGHGYGGAEPGDRLSAGALNAALAGGLGYGIAKLTSPLVVNFLGNLKRKFSMAPRPSVSNNDSVNPLGQFSDGMAPPSNTPLTQQELKELVYGDFNPPVTAAERARLMEMQNPTGAYDDVGVMSLEELKRNPEISRPQRTSVFYDE